MGWFGNGLAGSSIGIYRIYEKRFGERMKGVNYDENVLGV